MRRTADQHRAEWFYYTVIANDTGHTAYEVYEMMVRMFLKIVNEQGAVAYYKPAFLSIKQHSNYLDQIQVFMAEFGVILPERDQVPEDFKLEYKEMRTVANG